MIARNPRVLLLSDGAAQRASLQASLASAGSSSIVCNSDSEAFANIESARPKVFCSQFDARNEADVHRISLVMNLYPRLAIMLVGSSIDATPPPELWLNRVTGYVAAPWNASDVSACLSRALCPGESDCNHPSRTEPFLIGRSQAMQQVTDAILRLANDRQPILIQGEHGTGKKLTALALHSQSEKQALSIHTLDCAELGSEKLAALLFGPSRTPNLPPMLQDTRVGTVVLGELAAISPAVQSNLIDRIRNRDPQSNGPRIVFTTSRDLGRLVANRKVRADLFLELSSQVIGLPPLRHRRGDIRLLVEYFATHLNEYLQGLDQPPLSIEEQIFQTLESYKWPYNVRELRAVLVSAALRDSSNAISAKTYIKNVLAASTAASSDLDSKENLDATSADQASKPLPRCKLAPVRELANIATADRENATVSFNSGTEGASPSPEETPQAAASELTADAQQQYWALMIDRLAADESSNIYARALELFEKELFTRVLDKTGGSIQDSARLLGMTNLTLKKKIQHLEIKVPEVNA